MLTFSSAAGFFSSALGISACTEASRSSRSSLLTFSSATGFFSSDAGAAFCSFAGSFAISSSAATTASEVDDGLPKISCSKSLAPSLSSIWIKASAIFSFWSSSSVMPPVSCAGDWDCTEPIRSSISLLSTAAPPGCSADTEVSSGSAGVSSLWAGTESLIFAICLAAASTALGDALGSDKISLSMSLALCLSSIWIKASAIFNLFSSSSDISSLTSRSPPTPAATCVNNPSPDAAAVLLSGTEFIRSLTSIWMPCSLSAAPLLSPESSSSSISPAVFLPDFLFDSCVIMSSRLLSLAKSKAFSSNEFSSHSSKFLGFNSRIGRSSSLGSFKS